MAHFLVDRDKNIDLACKSNGVVLDVFCHPEEDSHGKLVIQIAALDVAGLRDVGPGAWTDEIAHFKTEFPYVIGTCHILIQYDFHRIEVPDYGIKVLVYVRRCIDQLDCTLEDITFATVDVDVLRLGVAGLEAADV